VQDEDQRNQVQSGVQVPGGAKALKAEGKGAAAQVARAYGVHLVTLAKRKRHFLEHGAEMFKGKSQLTLYASRATGVGKSWSGWWRGR